MKRATEAERRVAIAWAVVTKHEKYSASQIHAAGSLVDSIVTVLGAERRRAQRTTPKATRKGGNTNGR